MPIERPSTCARCMRCDQLHLEASRINRKRRSSHLAPPEQHPYLLSSSLDDNKFTLPCAPPSHVQHFIDVRKSTPIIPKKDPLPSRPVLSTDELVNLYTKSPSKPYPIPSRSHTKSPLPPTIPLQSTSSPHQSPITPPLSHPSVYSSPHQAMHTWPNISMSNDVDSSDSDALPPPILTEETQRCLYSDLTTPLSVLQSTPFSVDTSHVSPPLYDAPSSLPSPVVTSLPLVTPQPAISHDVHSFQQSMTPLQNRSTHRWSPKASDRNLYNENLLDEITKENAESVFCMGLESGNAKTESDKPKPSLYENMRNLISSCAVTDLEEAHKLLKTAKRLRIAGNNLARSKSSVEKVIEGCVKFVRAVQMYFDVCLFYSASMDTSGRSDDFHVLSTLDEHFTMTQDFARMIEYDWLERPLEKVSAKTTTKIEFLVRFMHRLISCFCFLKVSS
ncbi:hypothetical protein GEMRC1_010315 [Eukaryota sp. GEM-RC1]